MTIQITDTELKTLLEETAKKAAEDTINRWLKSKEIELID